MRIGVGDGVVILDDVVQKVGQGCVRWTTGAQRVVFVAKHRAAQTVTVVPAAPCQQRGNFCRRHRFGLDAGGKKHIPTLIDKQKDRPLFFFIVQADPRRTHTRGGLPVHQTNVITGLVAAQTVKIKPATLLARNALSGQRVGRDLPWRIDNRTRLRRQF